jgi:hypothetical protein
MMTVPQITPEVPLVDIVVPLGTLVAGFAAPRMLRRLLRRG